LPTNIKQLYERSAGEPALETVTPYENGRQEFLDAAHEVAELTLPDLRPLGRPIDNLPYSSLPGKFVRGLASTLVRTLFPATTEWYEYQYGTDVQRQIDSLDDELSAAATAELDGLLDDRRTYVKNFIMQRQVIARLARLLRRILVEGQVGLQVLKDRIRVHPLRTLAIKRHSGELIYWIIKEQKRITFKDMTPGGDHENKFLYTLIDPINGEVWQQTDDEAPTKIAKGTDGGDVRQYVLATSEFADTEDYVYGFAWHFKGLLSEIDNMAASLGEATANAAWAILLVDPLANVTAEEIKNQWVSGSAAIARADQFKWLTSGVKLNDFGFIASYLNDLRRDGRDIFLDEEPQAEPDVTATAVLRRAERIDQQTSDLLVSLETSLQKPLVEAVEAALKLAPITVDKVNGPIQIVVTTGSSAIQQDMRAMRGLQKIGMAKELDPLLVVDGMAALAEIGRGDGFNYGNVVTRVDPQAMAEAEAEMAAEEGATDGGTPGTVQESPGGPQPQLDPNAEATRRESQRIPPAAA
jgi:hypothetical protein